MTSMTRGIARLLLLPGWMVAFAILVKGYTDTGDGFSAGVVAGLAVLLQFVVFGKEEAAKLPPVRYARHCAFAGMLIALVITFIPVLRGEPLLTHWPPAGQQATHLGTVELITAAAFDVGVFLLLMSFCVATVTLLADAAGRRRR